MGPTATGDTPREQRLAAAGRVAAALLHEFRNVLAPVANLAFVLERQADDPAKVRELARRLGEMATVRSRVAERLRDFIRQDAARFPDDAVVDLAVIARDAVALCLPIASARPDGAAVRLSCDAPNTVLVSGDAAELRTAAVELILNALDAIPAAGTVSVEVRAEGNLSLLAVHDDGAGAPAGMAEMAFDPFISTKEKPDAGLGLSAAWGIARRHGGELSLVNNPSKGTTASLKISRLPDDAYRRMNPE